MSAMPSTRLFQCDHLAVIAVNGEEATSFLQGQLTADLRNLATGDNRLAMHLNLKGRGMVSMRLFRTDSGFDMVVPTGMAESALAGLRKFALFSKVTLETDPGRQVFGVSDEALAAELGALPLHGPGPARWMLLADSHPSVNEPVGCAEDWLALDVAAGIAHIFPGGEDTWLPQALNYDLMDGVHFNKGCYLGQEVVARMHFKGQMKQRMRAWEWPGDTCPAVGSVFRDAGGKAVGELVVAVPRDGLVQALVVTRLDHHEDLVLDDQPLNAREVSLPYALPEA